MTEPIVVEVLNWAEELVEEPVYYKGGIDQFLGSGKYEAFVPYEEPASVLKAGVLYFGENGMIVCRKCARLRATRLRRGMLGFGSHPVISVPARVLCRSARRMRRRIGRCSVLASVVRRGVRGIEIEAMNGLFLLVAGLSKKSSCGNI